MNEAEPLSAGSIVSIEPRPTDPSAADRTVAEIAAAHGGHYSLDVHLNHDLIATADFAEAHRRRLKAMRRADIGVEGEPDGTWMIVPTISKPRLGLRADAGPVATGHRPALSRMPKPAARQARSTPDDNGLDLNFGCLGPRREPRPAGAE